MGETIIDGAGSGYFLKVNSDGSLNTNINLSGASISTGSNVWVQNFPAMQQVSISGIPLVVVSGIDVNIGSAIFNLEDVYVRSGANITGSMFLMVDGGLVSSTNPVPISPPLLGYLITQGSVYQATSPWIVNGSTFNLNPTPTLVSQNPYTTLVYISSGTNTGISTGSSIGSIIKFIDAGSYVKVLTYNNNNLVNIGSWV